MAEPMVTRRGEEFDVQSWLKRLEDLKGKRSNFDTHWEEIAQRIWPDADEFRTQRAPGEKRLSKVFDSTAILALERFAAILESLNTPRYKMWHNLRASEDELNKDAETKRWFEQVNRILADERQRPKANYHSQMHEGYKSLGAFGGHPLYVDENPSGGLRYRYCHIGQLYVAVDHQGMIDTIFRVFKQSAKAAAQMFGEDKLGARVREALVSDKLYHDFEFVHIVAPRRNVDPERLDFRATPWMSVYLGCEDRNIISQGGYREMPYCYSRWTVSPSEVYGRSPAMLALPTIKGVNEMVKTYQGAAHRSVNPPLLLPDDGVWGAGSKAVRNVPGGLNYGGVDMQGRPMIVPLNSGANIPQMEELLEVERSTIKSFFLVDLFRTLLEDPRPNVTATEILQRAQEKGDLIAPEVGRIQSELLGPSIEREIAILSRQGRLPPPPPAFLEAGGQYKVEYVSEASRLQKSREQLAIRNTVELAVSMAAVDPKATLILKSEEVIRRSAEYDGAPSEILRTPEEMEQLLAAQQQQEQQAQQLAALQQGAAAAKDGGAALASVAQAGQVRGQSAAA